MSSYELVIYIRNEMALNTSKEQIITHLVAAGWQKEEVERAFHEVSKTAGFPDGTVTFPDLQPKRPRHIMRSIGRWVVIFLLCVVIIFTAFSILFNVGLVGPEQQSTDESIRNAIQIITSSTSSPAVAPLAATSTTNISQSDKNQIISAILTQGTVMQSGSAADIRNYLEITASLAYHLQLQNMSDSNILALASTMTTDQSYITADRLNSLQTVWKQADASTFKVTIQTPNGPVTRTAHEVNGVWY
jgi:hypothetical protein